MSTVNIGQQNQLINSRPWIIRHIEFPGGSAGKVYIKFSDEQSGSNALRSS